ncbi:methyltransferase domain-containing protein [Azospirillum brasilense]|uniref:Methyltransferase domain-containing protein n=1 Tax=Azospirillum brasilense TaxID=192 RepID=A0A4D8R7H4_AZOBR|nr:methyltransferase domain-containing protein [Azospirillum brasilense]QCO15299.1 methyltransferase domain-containing protein [Azospirillum brasilense]
MSDPLYDDRFYDIQEEGSLRSARVIAPLVLGWVGAESVLDVGCGVGTFLRAFAEAGIADVQGLDGDYVRRDRLRIDPSRFSAHDLSQPFDLGRRFGLVLSLEVAEHLPEERAEGFVDDLCRHGDVVLFGAAIPGQGATATSTSNGRAIGPGSSSPAATRPSTSCALSCGPTRPSNSGTDRTR